MSIQALLYRLTPNAIHYSMRQLAYRAGVSLLHGATTGFEDLKIPVIYGAPDQIQLQSPGVIISRCSETSWSSLLTKHQKSLQWLPFTSVIPPNSWFPINDPIPVLFWGEGFEDGTKPFAERLDNGIIIFYVDILASSFFMLSRWEEIVNPIRDQHDRFPATASVAYNQGFLDRPIVDEYALILQIWLKSLLPRWNPQTSSFKIKPSHDIDCVRQFTSPYKAIRTLLGDLLKRHNLNKAKFTLKYLAEWNSSAKKDPFMQGIYHLAYLSSQFGLVSSFNFKTSHKSRFDSGYDPSTPLISQCIKYLYNQGHEIGFHPGYYTYNDLDKFIAEKMRMDAILGHSNYGGRQHYLRFQTPQTWRIWERSGLIYDSTMGYPDYEGFRCGTCHPYQPFDIEQDRQINLIEIPIIVMDSTLRHYRKLTPEQAEECILKLAKFCHQVRGTFTILWHNTSLHGEWRVWADMYGRLLPKLMAMT